MRELWAVFLDPEGFGQGLLVFLVLWVVTSALRGLAVTGTELRRIRRHLEKTAKEDADRYDREVARRLAMERERTRPWN